MIIVSQDRLRTTDSITLKIEMSLKNGGEFPKIETIKEYEISDIHNIYLGKYDTEERAKEILKGISEAYIDGWKRYELPLE